MSQLQFSPESQLKINKIVSRYPDKMAACLPVLYVAQEQFGYLSTAVQDLVAETLNLPPAHVFGVATFYSLFTKKKLGRFHLQVCTNISCMLCNGYEVLKRLEEKLDIKVGETTPDGLFTLSEVECLAYCGTAPVVQVNSEVHELLSPDKVEELIAMLKAQASAADGGGSLSSETTGLSE